MVGASNLLDAVKMAYKKHVLMDDSIGWDELVDCLYSALCNHLTDDGFVEWLRKQDCSRLKQEQVNYLESKIEELAAPDEDL